MNCDIQKLKQPVLAIMCIIIGVSSRAQFGQLNEKISIDVRQTDALAVIELLDGQSNYYFTFAQEQLSAIKIDSLKAKDESLGNVLTRLQRTWHLQFSILQDHIMVKAEDKLLTSEIKQKQSGNLSGRIVDFENGDPLVGATVNLQGTSYHTYSNEKGNYSFNNIAAGEYTLLTSYVGYRQDERKQVIIVADKTEVVDIKLQVGGGNAAVMTGVVVTAKKNRRVANTTDAQLVQEMYNAQTVVSGISNEQIARTLDRDAAEVVKRIPGVNISPDNFVIVRGLGKRYNLTFLNDAIAPAADADSRSFSYDVISSNAIDRILVFKSPSPDLPGEFSGGVVKIYTKKSQVTRQFDFQVSTQYRKGSTFENTWSYAGGKYDFLGFDDGTRKFPKGLPDATTFNHLDPASNALYSKQFKNIYLLDKSYRSLPDLRLNLNYYDAWKIGSKFVKNLTTIAYTNTHEQRVTEQNSLLKYHDSKITQGIHGARISAIQSNEIKVNEQLTFELRNFFNINNQRIAVEDYRLLDDFPTNAFRHTNLYYVQQQLFSSQLSGTYLFGEQNRNTLKANMSYSTIHKQEPDNRDYTLNRSVSPNDVKEINDPTAWSLGNELISFYMLSRVFTDVKENNYQGNIDLAFRINPIWGFKTGIYHENRAREFSNRTFVLLNGVNLYDPNLSVFGSKYGSDNGNTGGGIAIQEKYLHHYFNETMFREDGTGYRWVEKTTPNNQYYADNLLNAAYISSDIYLFQNQVNVFGGIRLEDNRFRILGSYENGLATYPLVVDQHIASFLPSLNISYKIDSNIILRMGYGKTLNRPEFREAAPLRYTNYIDQESYTGNPELTTVNIHNAEFRVEWYPNSARKSDMMNIGVFYKQLDRPIERFRMVFSEGFDQYVYTNTGKAIVIGMEAEIRKDLHFLPGRFLSKLSTIVNGSWFHSKVNVPSLPQFVGYAGTRTRPMQGQSPYLINASLNYEDAGSGTKVSFTYNRADDYIYAVGANKGERLDTDIMMHARDQLDITWRQRINKIFSINAGVQNVLNAPIMLYQDWKRNYSYDQPSGKEAAPGVLDEHDIVFRKYYQHPYFSLALNMIF